MDAKRIISFLTRVAQNNKRPWFQEHKAEFEACKTDFETGITQLIATLATMDPEVAHLTVRDCCYRFYRDTRFSADKSPYKRHFGAYICAHGRKALRGGYYVHLQPGHSFIAVGSYWLPTHILTSCRNEIMGNIDQWRRAVEAGEFVKLFGYPGDGVMTDDELSAKGFGIAMLKTAPKGFPRDYEYIDYLRMKDYCCWMRVPDELFDTPDWQKQLLRYFRVAKPMMDFINAVVDDYE